MAKAKKKHVRKHEHNYAHPHNRLVNHRYKNNPHQIGTRLMHVSAGKHDFIGGNTALYQVRPLKMPKRLNTTYEYMFKDSDRQPYENMYRSYRRERYYNNPMRDAYSSTTAVPSTTSYFPLSTSTTNAPVDRTTSAPRRSQRLRGNYTTTTEAPPPMDEIFGDDFNP